jgi:chromosome segregation protein
MRRTLENLDRLTDLRDELGRQLQHLQRQAQAAEKYTEFKAEERELKAQLLALQCQALDTQIKAATQAVGELEVKLEGIHSEHQHVDTAIEQHRVDYTDRSDDFNKVQANYYLLGSEVARIEQTIKHQQERGRQLQDDLTQTAANLTEAESHLGDDRSKLASWETEIETLGPELEQLQELEAASAEALQQAEEAMHDWQHQWDEFNQHAAEPRQQAEVQQSRIQHMEQVLQRLQGRTRQLEEEKQGLAAGPADTEADELGEQLAEIELSMAEHERHSETLVQTLASNRDRRTQLSGELNQLRSALQQMRGRSASLEALQQAAMQDGSEGVGAWLQSNQLENKSRLLEKLQVENGWQLAVETVLGDYLQAVCVDDIGALGALLGNFEQGNLLLVEAAGGASAAPEYLASRVQSGGRADGLLAGIRVADDVTQALLQRASLAPHESVITRDGIWMGRSWLRISKASNSDGGVIQRQQELESLAASIDEQQQREAQLSDELQACEDALKALEEQRQECQRALQASTRQHAEIRARVSAYQAKAEQITLRHERINSEIDEARAQFRQEQEAVSAARSTLAEAIERMETDSRRREELLAQRDQIRGTLDAARQQARQDKDGAHQVAMRYQSLNTQLTAVRETIDRTDRQVAQLRERQASLTEALRESDDPLAGLRDELEQQLELRLLSESELSAARQLVAEVEHQLRQAEQQRAAIEQRAQTVRSELERQRISNQTLQVQRATIYKQLQDGKHELEAVLGTMPEGANEPEWQVALERVANRIARLGPINLAAIDEYTLQSERKNYLDAQNEDLVTALETLESAIRKIDKETRNRFRETFEKVNSGLQDLFPRVFGGGSAYLEMTGDDLLDTGITIMARPPGKKNATIHLLSGGEKALTAIALVFSIFHLNPAPFCILDEVDAPLDDANTGRYARLVKEMSDKVQFIYITHNKISMEFADQLMGVTMHEPGVSRLVSVDVEEAAALAAS